MYVLHSQKESAFIRRYINLFIYISLTLLILLLSIAYAGAVICLAFVHSPVHIISD